MRTLDGRLALVTGAASGLGFAIAQALAERGARLVVTDVDGDALAAARERFAAEGTDVLALALDVTDRDAFAEVLARAESERGALHVMVNNAGVYRGGRLDAVSWSDWDWVLGVNLGGVVNGVQLALPRLLTHGEEAHLVNVASMAGLVGVPGLGVYNTSKFAVVGLSEALRADLAETPVGVSVLCPGMVRTRILESERTRPSAYADVDERADRAAREQAERMRAAMESGIEASEVGRAVATGILENRFWLLTHPDAREVLEARHLELVDAVERASRDRAPAEP